MVQARRTNSEQYRELDQRMMRPLRPRRRVYTGVQKLFQTGETPGPQTGPGARARRAGRDGFGEQHRERRSNGFETLVNGRKGRRRDRRDDANEIESRSGSPSSRRATTVRGGSGEGRGAARVAPGQLDKHPERVPDGPCLSVAKPDPSRKKPHGAFVSAPDGGPRDGNRASRGFGTPESRGGDGSLPYDRHTHSPGVAYVVK